MQRPFVYGKLSHSLYNNNISIEINISSVGILLAALGITRVELFGNYEKDKRISRWQGLSSSRLRNFYKLMQISWWDKVSIEGFQFGRSRSWESMVILPKGI